MHGHQLHRDIVVEVAVFAPILGRKASQKLTGGQRRDGLGADAHRHVIALPDVAEPERDLEARRDIRDLLQLGRDLGLHLCDIAGESAEIEPLQRRLSRAGNIVCRRREHEAKRRQHARPQRDQYPADAELSGKIANVNRAGSAKCHDHQAGGVAATLADVHANGSGHRFIDDVVDGPGRSRCAQT